MNINILFWVGKHTFCKSSYLFAVFRMIGDLGTVKVLLLDGIIGDTINSVPIGSILCWFVTLM